MFELDALFASSFSLALSWLIFYWLDRLLKPVFDRWRLGPPDDDRDDR